MNWGFLFLEVSMENYVKHFFGPTWEDVIWKSVVGFGLFLLVTFIYYATWPWVDYWAMGWPLHFSETGGPCFSETSACSRSSTFALVFDIVFWYLIYCLTDFIYQIIKE
jgi:hypothetical protein